MIKARIAIQRGQVLDDTPLHNVMWLLMFFSCKKMSNLAKLLQKHFKITKLGVTARWKQWHALCTMLRPIFWNFYCVSVKFVQNCKQLLQKHIKSHTTLYKVSKSLLGHYVVHQEGLKITQYLYFLLGNWKLGPLW